MLEATEGTFVFDYFPCIFKGFDVRFFVFRSNLCGRGLRLRKIRFEFENCSRLEGRVVDLHCQCFDWRRWFRHFLHRFALDLFDFEETEQFRFRSKRQFQCSFRFRRDICVFFFGFLGIATFTTGFGWFLRSCLWRCGSTFDLPS